MQHFDATDRKVLWTLNHNARISISDLARSVRLGRDLVSYRVERLEREGVIRGYAAAVNPYALGFTQFKNYLRLRNDPKRVRALMSELQSHPDIFCYSECDGTWDILFNMLARSAYEFHQIQSELLSSYADIVLAFNVNAVVNHWYYPKKFLVNKTGEPFLIGGRPGLYELEDLEIELLKFLSTNGRAALSEIAQALDSTPIVVRARLERLVGSGVISIFRTNIDRSMLGLTYFKVRLFQNSFEQNKLKALKDFAVMHPYISYLIEQIGDVKSELAVEARDYEHFTSIVNEIKYAFPDLVTNVETLLIKNDQHFWAPVGMLNGEGR